MPGREPSLAGGVVGGRGVGGEVGGHRLDDVTVATGRRTEPRRHRRVGTSPIVARAWFEQLVGVAPVLHGRVPALQPGPDLAEVGGAEDALDPISTYSSASPWR